MVSVHTLTVDISTNDESISEEEFKEMVKPSLEHLTFLKGAFDRKPSSVIYYPPNKENNTECLGWSLRGVVLISVGRERGEFLLKLYESIVDLIALELPKLDVEASTSRFDFDK